MLVLILGAVRVVGPGWLTVVCHSPASLTATVQAALATTDLWSGAFSTVRNGLRDGGSVLERWATAAKQLTGTFWTTEAHAWVGDAYVTTAPHDAVTRDRRTAMSLLGRTVGRVVAHLWLLSSVCLLAAAPASAIAMRAAVTPA